MLSLSNACRAGSRYACVQEYKPDETSQKELEQKVSEVVKENVPSTLKDVNVKITSFTKNKELYYRIEAKGKVSILTVVVGVFYPGQMMDISTESVVKVESIME